MSAKVAYMQKITLTVDMNNPPGENASDHSPAKFDFVYGMGSAGLTPLEFALSEKNAGDEVHLQLRPDQIPAFFGHIRPPALHVQEGKDPIDLRVRILEVSPATGREVVRTLADVANCGDNCCGHH